MLVNWRPDAQEALQQIVDYISSENPIAAFELFEAIKQATSELPQHPFCIATAGCLAHEKL